MDRRTFLQRMAALTLGEGTGAPVPADFVGLSYESAQLANPALFAPTNRALIELFRELAPAGNLRIGGGSSEFTRFSAAEPTVPPPFDVFGPDTSHTQKSGTVTTLAAIRNLRGFLDATRWNCLYGLNLGQGTVENAVAEAKAVQQVLGPRLLAFQIGNEPDSFRNRYRPASYGPADYLAEWTRFHDAIAAAVPGARFAGPDISNKLAYLTAFAAEAPKHPDVILLTSHYYAMGPAGNPQATLDNLLDPDPKLTTLKARDLHVIAEACATAHLPYRMSEGNSCWNGGQTGVSDTFASALWCADYLLTCMHRGWVGANLHGGGNGVYAPIVGSVAAGFQRRPQFYGIRFAQAMVGAQCIPVTLAHAGPRVSAFAFQRGGTRELALVNKTADPFPCAMPTGMRAALTATLSAPAVDAKQGVQLQSNQGRPLREVQVPPYSAARFHLSAGEASRFEGDR